jgi:hypothetical protein
MPRLYSEVMRACLITLNDALGMSIESQWGAFTFLKVPHILRQLHLAIRGEQARHYADISRHCTQECNCIILIFIHLFIYFIFHKSNTGIT